MARTRTEKHNWGQNLLESRSCLLFFDESIYSAQEEMSERVSERERETITRRKTEYFSRRVYNRNEYRSLNLSVIDPKRNDD